MKSIHKNALALACIKRTLADFNIHPKDYILNYEQQHSEKLFDETDTRENSDNFKRDLKLLANEYYRRISK